MQQIYDLTSLRASWRTRTDLKISCSGRVPTTGWTEPSLVARYVQPPPDGIWEFDFVATPPAGPSLPQLSDVQAETEWAVPFGAEPVALGFRVYSSSNSMEKLFSEISGT